MVLPSPIISRQYRPDIDGLRAFAVLIVIFYHVGFSSFGGGFIGVDIFFVISGFLITRNIVSDIEKGKFTFGNFYIRRVRRLFPAMFFTFATTLLIAIILFTPEHLQRLGKSIIFSTLSVSNFFFWSEAGYFDTDADYKPLLHTWSLAVEEQFYLVWPSILVALMWFKRNWLVFVFLILSASISLYFTQQWLTTDPSGAFYLTPFRITEFAIGAACVWMIKYQSSNQTVSESFTAIGMAAITIPALTYTEKTAFPGINALLPCLGTALLIYCGPTRRLGLILNNPVSLGIGAISYSAYLAHWPIIIFYKYWKMTPLDLSEQIIIVIASLTIAVIMYHYIEAPFRKYSKQENQLSPAIFSARCGELVIIICLVSSTLWYFNGWEWRTTNEVGEIVSSAPLKRIERFKIFQSKCNNTPRNCMQISENKINIVILGDSHGADGYNAYNLAYPEANVILASEGGCPPFLDITYLPENNPHREKCIQHNQFVFYEWGMLNKADLIVFSALLDDQSLPRIQKTIKHLQNTTNSTIVILGTAMIFDKDVPTLITSHGDLNNINDYVMTFARKNIFIIDKQYKNTYSESEVNYISKLDIFCPKEKCEILLGDTNDLLTYDRHHLSMQAAVILSNALKKRVPDINNL